MTVTTLAETVNADNALDLWAYLIVGLPGTIGAVIAGVIGWKSRQSHADLRKSTEAIRESVVNGHPRPMRYDLDDVAAALIALRGDIADVAHKVDDLDERTGRIGDETREEAVTRRSADAATNAKVDEALAWAKAVTARHHPESMHDAPGGTT